MRTDDHLDLVQGSKSPTDLTRGEEAAGFGLGGIALLIGALFMSLAVPWLAVLIGVVAGAMMTTAVAVGEWSSPWGR